RVVAEQSHAEYLSASMDERTYFLAALRAACSLASSSWESDDLRTFPPLPASSSSTLSGVDLRTRTKSVDVPGCSVLARSFMNASWRPMPLRARDAARAVAPNAMRRRGLKKIKPISAPQKPPLTAPAVVRFTV